MLRHVNWKVDASYEGSSRRNVLADPTEIFTLSILFFWH